jgi:HEAT repeats
VLLWLTVSWLVRRTSARPEDVIAGLEQGPRIARWQRASELADMLRSPRFIDFRRNPEAAKGLAGILSREIDAATAGHGMEDEDITLRRFLSRALGEFDVIDGTDALIKAAETNRDPQELLVRQGALEGIAVRAFNLRNLKPPQELNVPELDTALARLAGDEEPSIRYRTAFALGQIATPTALSRLEKMVDDPDADTRYNAAVGLAHHGNAKAMETLAEMLDLEELASVRGEENEQDRDNKRALVLSNALRASTELVKKNPTADVAPIVDALNRLVAADADTLTKARIPSRAVSDAKRVLDKLQPASQH